MVSPKDIVHYVNCNADYPEKPDDEAPQGTTKVFIDEAETLYVLICVDCGASVDNIPPEAIPTHGIKD